MFLCAQHGTADDKHEMRYQHLMIVNVDRVWFVLLLFRLENSETLEA